MNVRIMIVRVRFDVPHTPATGETQRLLPFTHSPATVWTGSRITLVVALAFLAGLLFAVHPALCLGAVGVCIAVVLKMMHQAVQL